MSPLSLSPHVRSTRLTITDPSPPRATQLGQDRPLEHLAHLVRHAGHGEHDLLGLADRTGQIRPGAVPRVCGMIEAPTGTSA